MARSRRAYLAAAGGTIATATLSGCVSDSAAQDDLDPDVDGVDLVLNWQPSGLHVPYYAAADRGFYEDQGLADVSIESGQGSDFSATQAALENAAFAVTSGDQVLNVAAEGLSPVCVGVIMQRGPVVLFADRESFGEELTDPAQLEGTTIGGGPGMVDTMSRAYVEYHDLEGVEFVDAGQDVVQQLLTGEIDVAAGVFSDAVDARQQGATIDELRVADDVPAYGHVIATSETFLEENPDAVRAFLRGTARGAAWGATEVEAAVDALVAAAPELEEARANQREKWETLAAEYMVTETVEERGWGWNDGDVWSATADLLADHGVLEDDVDPDAVWTNEYLDAAYPYVGEFVTEVEGGVIDTERIGDTGGENDSSGGNDSSSGGNGGNSTAGDADE